MGTAPIDDGPTMAELSECGVLELLVHSLRRQAGAMDSNPNTAAVGTIMSGILIASSALACAEGQAGTGSDGSCGGVLKVWCGVDIGLVASGSGLVSAVPPPLAPGLDLQLNLRDLEGEDQVGVSSNTRRKLDSMKDQRAQLTAGFLTAEVPAALVSVLVQVAGILSSGSTETATEWAPVVWR
jgi:hypothetical protein